MGVLLLLNTVCELNSELNFDESTLELVHCTERVT